MTRKPNLQERITTGQFTLPVVILIVSVIWLIGSLSPIGGTDHSIVWNKVLETLQGPLLKDLAGYLLFGLAVVQLLILHNTFALIRTHSNFYLTLFVLFAGLLLPQTLSIESTLVPCLLFFTYSLFHTYQAPNPVGYTFQSFIFVGLGSILFPPLLYYLPFFYISLANMRALTWRTFFAGILGIGLPYWGLLTYALFVDNTHLFFEPFLKLVPTIPVSYSDWSLSHILMLSYIILITVVGSMHCIVNNYEDKIKTRTLLSYFIILQAYTLVFIFLQPQYFFPLFSILTIGSSIVAGHLFALSHTKACNLFFLLCLILFIALIAYHIWTYSHSIY